MRISTPQPTKPANIINHIGFVLDASSSMRSLAPALIRVADEQVKHLARRSQELEQETRISIWTFSYRTEIHCAVWDMDVLRLPSIATMYRPAGNTALIDATLKSISDLSEIPTRYGDHSFLLYAFTDGEENDSLGKPHELAERILRLPDDWTLAAMVPSALSKMQAKKMGFPAGNVEVWDATSTRGVEEVGAVIRATTDSYMTARASGVRSTRTLFSTDASAVNASTIKQASMVPLARNKYMLIPVPSDCVIKDFTESCGQNYVLGRGYYELSKPEDIQPQKEIAIVERNSSGNVYIGGDARQMLGLPDMQVRVRPSYNPDYTVFVQSTSINRKLKVGTKYLYLI